MTSGLFDFVDASRVQYEVTKVARQASVSQTPTSASASQLYVPLWPNVLIALACFSAFLVLRRVYPRVYVPRTFSSSIRPQERAPKLPNGLFNWFMPFWKTPDTVVLNTQSLDSFLFLRLLKMAVVICVVGICLTWPILWPVNGTGPGGQQQLNLLTLGNATSPNVPSSYFRWFAHALVAWLFYGFFLYMVTRESIYYINLRQAYLVSPLYANRLSAKTVLFTSVPDAYLDEAVMKEMLGPEAVRVWIPRDVTELDKEVSERDKIALKLEAAETKLMKTANANRLKAIKQAEKKKIEPELPQVDDSGDIASRYVTSKQRPTHKLKFLGLAGQKVDSIDWCREELSKRIPAVKAHQEKHNACETKALHSVFVQFSSLRAAQAAYQSLTHHQPLHMSERFTGLDPGEVIWKNLDISWWSRVIRQFIVIGFVTFLVVFWTIPVAFIGFVSNIFALASSTNANGSPSYPWLTWLLAIPQVIQGIVSGFLPTILLAVLMALLPIFLRLAARFAGSATLSEVEYRTQNYYFAFQVVQVFLIQSLASGAIGSLSSILSMPASAPGFLAQKLPSASNFYIAYFELQGLTVVFGMLLGIVGLLLFKILGKFLDGTPRKQLIRWMNLSTPGLGTVYPIFTNLLVISLAYGIIAPLVLGFAAITFGLFYVAYRYQFLYVYGSKFDTKGLMYPRALQQLMVGLYIAQVCIIGLFAIGVGSAPSQAVGPLILMIVFLVFTALYHISLNAALDPLLKFLPKTLETEERRLLAMEEQDGTADNGVDEIAKDGENGAKTVTVHTSNKKQQPNMFVKWLRPDIHADYHTLRELVPRGFAEITYDETTEREAFNQPCTVSQPPLLWIPRDSMGISTQSVKESSKVIDITDEGCVLNEKNELEWDHTRANEAPVYEEKVYY